MPAVTLLLPVHNSAGTLADTLRSLFAQTFADFELLVVDDGSEDGGPDILRACADPRLRVLRNPERLRLAGALNRGIAEARAPLIARMDADDIAHPGRLRAQVDYLRRHPDLVVCGTWTRHFGLRAKSCERYPVSWEDTRAFSLFNCPFAHPTVMFRRDLFLREGLRYDGTFYPAEDYELWSRLVHRFPCANLPRVLLDYRVHAAGMTGSDWDNMDAQSRRLMVRQFASLGLDITEDEARLHRDIGMARVGPDRLSEARDWLESLDARNRGLGFCPPAALLRELRERWFQACMNATRGGRAVPRLYASSRLLAGDPRTLARRLLVRASALRRGRKA